MKALLALLGPLKLPLLGGLVAIVLLGGAYVTGRNHERAVGEANSLRQQLETIKADKLLADQAAISAADKAATLEAEARAFEKELDDVRKALAARPEGGGRPADDADLDLIYGPR